MTCSRRRLPFAVGVVLTAAACLLTGTARADSALGLEGGVAAAPIQQPRAHNKTTHHTPRPPPSANLVPILTLRPTRSTHL